MTPGEKACIKALVEAFIEGHGLDGGDIFDLLKDNGILHPPVPFNPEKHTDIHGALEPGDEWYEVKDKYL